MLPLNTAFPEKIRTVLSFFGVGRTVEPRQEGDYPVFIGQVILKTLGSKVGKQEQLVYHLDPEIDCAPEGGDGFNICDAYYHWAQRQQLVTSTKEWVLTAGMMVGEGEEDERLVVNLINRGTGMGIPFYL